MENRIIKIEEINNERNKQGKKVCIIYCKCGNTKKVRLSNVLNKNTKSCGCLDTGPKIKHGFCKSTFYFVWQNMIQRCSPNKKDSKNYYNRGIRVCNEWKDFNSFFQDMYPSYKKGLSLDRINNNGNYCKENCRWATQKEQSSNRRTSIIYNGECASDVSKRLGGFSNLINHRLKRGWSLEKAFTTIKKSRG